MVSNLLRYFCLILISFLLSGCVASSYVGSIGAKAIYAESKITDINDTMMLSVIKAEQEVSSWSFAHGAFYPYTNLVSAVEGVPYGTLDFNYSDIKWENSYTGTLSSKVNDQLYVFNVFKGHGNITFTYKYREWYSYPAQGLLVATLPIDVAIVAVAIPVVIITASLSNRE